MSLPSADAPPRKLLCFALGGQQLALPIGAVKETIEARPLTRLFLVPPFVAGLVNLRGDVVAVLDLATLLGLGDGARREARNIVILRASLLPHVRDPRTAANRAGCGLLVDKLEGVRDVAPGDLKPPPPTLAAEAAGYLEGVAAVGTPPRPLVVIAPERVLGCERLRPYRRQGQPETR